VTIFLISFVGVGALLAGIAAQRWSAAARAAARGLLITYAVIGFALVAGELFFRFAYVDTEGRLASERWVERYWQTNTLGFRDREWIPTDWAAKTTVVIVGDSFAAGWGVEDPADRFGDVLGARLGDGYAVINLGLPGTSTPEQLETLRAFPLEYPDIVILQYFLNDIEYAALTLGLGIDIPQPPRLLRESYLGNFIYARFTAGFQPDYWSWQYGMYDRADVWAVHRAELEAFADHVESIGAQLIVVIFPNLQDPVGSIAYVDRVAAVFEGRGHDAVLKLFDAAAAWPREELIVSERDGHASAAFHRYVGERLYADFFAGQ